MDIPLTPSSITTEWLTRALEHVDAFKGAKIAGIETTDIGEGTGIFGEIALLTLTYAGQGSAPNS